MRSTAIFISSLLGVLLLSQEAFGRAGVGSGAKGLKNPKSLDGLCTVENKGQKWVGQGWCKTIGESLNKGCSGQVTERIRSKVQSGQIKDFQQYCPNINEIAGDQFKFSEVLKQMMAALTIEESDWRHSLKPNKYKAEGLMQVSVGSVRNVKAYSCGCSGIKGSKDLQDPHKNLKCGTYIALHWLDKDNTVGGGSGNKGARGIARYFQPFRNIDKHKRQRIQNKISNYCKVSSGGGAQPVDPPDADSHTTASR